MAALSVLYVEDDARDADLTRRRIGRLAPDVELKLAGTLATARDLISAKPRFDALLIDLNLPDGSGLELLGEIRDRSLPIAVIVVTGFDSGTQAIAALKGGADDFLVKRDGYLDRLPALLETAVARFHEENARKSRPLRVLHVVENPADVEPVRAHFVSHAPQLRLESATGIDTALKRLPAGSAETCAYDALLLDYRTRAAETLDALKTLRAERRLALPTVVLSAQSDGEIAAQAFRFGASNVLVKMPGYLHQLPSVLEAAHERAQLQREQQALRASERFTRAVLDSLSAQMAILDERGRIITVNESWRRFATANGGGPAIANPIGLDYVATSRAGHTDPDSIPYRAAEGIQAVLSGALERFSLEYPCNSPDSERWFEMQAVPMKGPLGQAIVTHQDITARKRAEAELIESELRVRQLFERSPIALALVAADGTLIQVNHAFIRDLGFAREQIIGRTALELGILADPSDRNRLLGEMGHNGSLPSLEVELARKDGDRLLVLASASRLKLHGEEFSLVSGVDITERKLTERALALLSLEQDRKGSAYFQQIALRVSEILDAEVGFVGRLIAPGSNTMRTVAMCIDGKLVPEMEFDLAGRPGEITFADSFAIFPENLQQRFPDNPMLARYGVHSYAAVSLKNSMGDAIGHLGIMSRHALRHPGRVRRLLSLFAASVSTEIERRESDARFRDLFEFSPDAHLIVDDEGRILQVNRQALSMFGREEHELAGHLIEELIPKAYRQGHVSLRRQYAAAPTARRMGTRSGQLYGLRKDGSVFPVDISLNPLRSEGASVCVVAVRDITARMQAEQQRKELEEQLRQSQKMEAVGTLAGGIAHDFNNILASIVGNVELARQNADPAHGVRMHLDQIGKAARRAIDLVKQILAFSRGQARDFHPMTLRPCVEEAAALLRSTLPASVQLAVGIAQDSPDIVGDPTQIQQILVNLCTNAWHAMEGEPGSITIRVEAEEVGQALRDIPAGLAPGRYARLVVSDTGKGISPAIRDRIFEPFFTTKPPGSGTGLGLAVVHGIVQSHQGAIQVESNVGEGTTFRLWFPAAAMPRTGDTAAVPNKDEPRGQGERILYIDDDESLLMLVQQLLGRWGYQVTTYQSARAAVRAIRAKPGDFDMVLTDFNMPEMSGLDAAEEILQVRPRIPIAITSGFITRELSEQAARLGIQHLLYKPDTVDELCELVHQLTKERMPRDWSI